MSRSRNSDPARTLFSLRGLILVCVLASLGYALYLDQQIRTQFEGKRWSLPARVYARPLELFVGKSITSKQLVQELKSLQYHFVRDPRYSGEVAHNINEFIVHTRPFAFWDGEQSAQEIRVRIDNDALLALDDLSTGKKIDLVRIDPELIGILYPAHNEDRILVRATDVPPYLLEMLVAIEDKGFYSHVGIDPLAIARAMMANLKAKRWVQGGSTLTQQLVKNYFLSSERTLTRKVNEAIMAMLLEFHYSKLEIIEAYLNEVYLGQDGQRAIHGFGLASQFYFEQELKNLSIDQMALLVALVKGASFYDPRRNSERATKRRNLVLGVAAQGGTISADQARRAQKLPLGVVGHRSASANRYPAFFDLVRRQLRRDYREEDLRTEGLRVFTTLSPWLQHSLEYASATQLTQLEERKVPAAREVQVAGVVLSPESAEVLALTGDRQPRYAGLNRALDMRRPIGSIVKPAVYLTALQIPERYTLASTLSDDVLLVEDKYSGDWSPLNYDQEFHGDVPLVEALAKSYNVATARLGLEVGLKKVIKTLKNMGIESNINPYPSLLLGAIELSPLEVAGMYQTLANGGFKSPLRSIRAVLGAQGQPLKRYPVSTIQVLDPDAVHLVNAAMQAVVSNGTARGLVEFLPSELHLAGKTGTTDDLRDSWFAGFSEQRLAVVWLGRDDNASTGLTGSSGAMRVWGHFMQLAGTRTLELLPTPAIKYQWVDFPTGKRSTERCTTGVQLPFIAGSEPLKGEKCSGSKKFPWRELRNLWN